MVLVVVVSMVSWLVGVLVCGGIRYWNSSMLLVVCSMSRYSSCFVL